MLVTEVQAERVAHPSVYSDAVRHAENKEVLPGHIACRCEGVRYAERCGDNYFVPVREYLLPTPEVKTVEYFPHLVLGEFPGRYGHYALVCLLFLFPCPQFHAYPVGSAFLVVDYGGREARGLVQDFPDEMQTYSDVY